MRYRLDLAYDGTEYHGWQIQPNGMSVQQMIQEKMSQICNHPIEIVGCGRTDTGVHASQYTAHFDFEGNLPHSLAHKLNKILPPDIRIHAVSECDDTFHARFDAILREYEYVIDGNASPFNHRYVWENAQTFDLELMNQACAHLIGEHEFRAFCKGAPPNDSYKCTLFHAAWTANNSQLIFRISANRFLRNMVRAIVGTCTLVGTHKMTVAEFAELIKTGTRSDAGNSVPAKGLFLCRVEYPN